MNVTVVTEYDGGVKKSGSNSCWRRSHFEVEEEKRWWSGTCGVEQVERGRWKEL